MTRFESEDYRRLYLLANTLKKPGTQILVEAVRVYMERVFNGQTVDQVMEERLRGTRFEIKKVAEKPEVYTPKVQKRLF